MSTLNNTNAFRVKWEIDVYADNAVEAAKEAWRQMRADGSTACFFTAVDEDGCCAFVSISLGRQEPRAARDSVGNAVGLVTICGLALPPYWCGCGCVGTASACSLPMAVGAPAW